MNVCNVEIGLIGPATHQFVIGEYRACIQGTGVVDIRGVVRGGATESPTKEETQRLTLPRLCMTQLQVDHCFHVS